MKTLENYIDEFKDKLNIQSDYKVAQELDIKRQQISSIRNGGISIGRQKCVRIASALKIDPLEIIASVEATKEKNPELRAIWIKLAKEKTVKK
jgi:transcriptional regulator with XRE-family HTH domain